MNEATILFNGRAAEFARHIIQDMKKIEDIFSKYTEDEQRNIYVYEKCNEAVV